MPLTDCPFRWVRREVQRLRQQTPLIILDFHAEATSEKLAMGWHLDGLVSAVVGTHTHVPTADASVLPLGTAYLTDVGMTGAYRGVIGMQAEGALQRMTTGVSARLKVATGDARLAGVTLELDPESGKALAIEPLLVRYAEGGPEASA